jgi:hypothetical protein
VAETLNSKFVGVTAGLGTCRTLSWIGSGSTAPETPVGVVTKASANAHTAPTGHSHGMGKHYRRHARVVCEDLSRSGFHGDASPNPDLGQAESHLSRMNAIASADARRGSSSGATQQPRRRHS